MSGLVKDMTFVEKRWGHELWICNSEKYCGKRLYINKGSWLSYHHHVLKDEVLYLESGKIFMSYGVDEINVTTIEMKPGEAFHVEPNLKHQMYAVEDAVIFEFSTQHFDSDSYRTTLDLVSSNK